MFHEKYLYFVFFSLTVFVFHAKSLYFVFFLLYLIQSLSFVIVLRVMMMNQPKIIFLEQSDFCLKQVMTSFGWSPSEEELKDMVNVIDQVGGLKLH